MDGITREFGEKAEETIANAFKTKTKMTRFKSRIEYKLELKKSDKQVTQLKEKLKKLETLTSKMSMRKNLSESKNGNGSQSNDKQEEDKENQP